MRPKVSVHNATAGVSGTGAKSSRDPNGGFGFAGTGYTHSARSRSLAAAGAQANADTLAGTSRTFEMRVAIYARYSSEQQREASIADQIEICTRYAGRHGWTIVATYTDAAASGAS